MPRRYLLVGGALALAAALSLVVLRRAWAAPPQLVEVTVVRALLRGAELPPRWAAEGAEFEGFWEDRFTLVVSDANGAGDIAEVTITNPAGQSVTVKPGTLRQQDGWRIETPTRVRVSVPPFPGRLPAEEGPYVLAVRDAAGHADQVTTPAVPLDPGLVSSLTAPSGAYTTLKNDAPTFAWSPGADGVGNEIVVEEYPQNVVWRYRAGKGKFAAYNADHTARQPRLLAGRVYLARLTSSYSVAGTDPRVKVRVEGRSSTALLLPTGKPTIQSVEVVRSTVHNTPGWRVYTDAIRVIATDRDGPSAIASVSVTAPGGAVYSPPVTAAANGIPYLVDTSYATPESFSPPAEGSFTATLTDRKGQRVSLTTAPVRRLTAFLEPVAPAPDAVLTERAPTYQWKNAIGPSTSVQLMWEARAAFPVWQAEVSGDRIAYNGNGTASEPELLPGYTYIWMARSRQEQKSDDARVKLWHEQVARARFRTYQDRSAGPKLPGRLIYGYYFGRGQYDRSAALGICTYDPDPRVPGWVGPIGISYPDLAPDGKRLVYITTDGVWLDPRDGTPPRRLAEGFCRDPRWSPDMKRVAFVRGTNIDPWGNPKDVDLWIVNADGTGARPLAKDPKANERYPAWSPDGKWIAFRCMPSQEARFLWLIRPDGSGLHPVVGTAAKGRPASRAVLGGNHSWSPDGRRLLTLFDASKGSQDWEPGIGSVAPEGGEVTPVFMSPRGTPQNLQAAHPEWSPDGARIAFCSGHHYPVGAPEDETYIAGELWVMNADGSGKPVRLSYDFSRINSIRWGK